MSKKKENVVHQELQIESAGGKAAEAETATLVISGVPQGVHNDPDKIRKILDILKLPKGTTVRIETRASSSIVR